MAFTQIEEEPINCHLIPIARELDSLGIPNQPQM